MSVTMEQMLESVTDAISAMVIFASEASNNAAVLKNLAAGATGVSSAVNYLVAQANQTVGLWEKLGSAEMAKRMKENNDGLVQAVEGIVNACKAVTENPKAVEPKAAILEEGKSVMKLMVGLIQYNDMYDVMVGLKQVHVAKDLLDQIFDDVFPADDFIVLIASISQVLERRMNNTHDSRARQWLKECKDELNELTVPLVTLVKRSWEDDSFTPKIRIVLEPFNDTIEKCIKALKLSAKSPFDLSMLDKAADFNFRDEDLDDIVVTANDFANALTAVRKALQEGDEFELERAVRAMEKDILAQLAAAEELANQMSDPVARAELLGKVKAAREHLADILRRLAEEIPKALKTGDYSKVNALMNELEKLFNTVSEELALHEIQKAGLSIDQLLQEIPPAVDVKDEVEARALNKDVQKEIARQGVMAKVLADGLDDNFRKNRIMNDVGKMAGLTGELSKATEDSLKDVPKARAHLDEVIAEIRKHNEDLVRAATLSTPEELLEVGAVIERSLLAMKETAIKGINDAKNASVLKDLQEKLNKDVATQTALAKSWAESMTDDPNLQKAITNAATVLGKEAGKLATSTKTLLSNPSSADAKKSFDEGIEKTRKANKDLIAVAFESPDEELEVLRGKLAADVNRLREATKAKNVPASATAITDIRKDVIDLKFLADVIAVEIEDEKVKTELKATGDHASERARVIAPQTKAAITDLKANYPTLDTSLTEIVSDAEKIIQLAGAGSPEDQLIKNADVLGKVARREAQEAEKGNGTKVAQKVKEAQRKVDKHERLAKAVASRCEQVLPDLAKKIVDETSKLAPLGKKLEDAASKVAKGTADTDSNKAMKDAQHAFKAQADLTAKLAKDIQKGKIEAEERAREAARLEAERRKREEEERERERQRRLAEANVPKGPVVSEIVEAVVAMQEVTDKYSVDSSAAGSLLDLANKLAIAFQQLASLAKTGTKKDLIMKAREIADIIKNIMKFIEAACTSCRDPLLCQELRDMGHVTLNFGTQLKIICGVKASLILEHDPDAANSLISCSRGLCGSVAEIVKLSQIAKLKPKQ